jgi:hypothetical protein
MPPPVPRTRGGAGHGGAAQKHFPSHQDKDTHQTVPVRETHAALWQTDRASVWMWVWVPILTASGRTLGGSASCLSGVGTLSSAHSIGIPPGTLVTPTWAREGTVKSMRPSPLHEYISRATRTLVMELMSSSVLCWGGGALSEWWSEELRRQAAECLNQPCEAGVSENQTTKFSVST